MTRPLLTLKKLPAQPPESPAQAAGLDTAKSKAQPPNPSGAARSSPDPSPATLSARQAIQSRLEAFPVWRDHLPLAVGVHKHIRDLLRIEGVPMTVSNLRFVMDHHIHNSIYQRNLVAGGSRYRLDGTPEGVVTLEQQDRARPRIHAA
ncbi:putative Fertility inhibition FinO-like protein [Gammaproteobacteria bacterium]